MIRAVIVDDEAPARDRLRSMLAGDAVKVVGEAGDGESAISCIEALQPDLVFLDIQMPAFTGLQVAARLRPPRPRIVFCTAYDHFAIEAFDLHAVDYLLKPVSRERLGRTVERISVEIEEQRRLARERVEAARTQRKLMPSDFRASGIVCAGASQPAEDVGGDYYDFLHMTGGRIAFVLGDVSGKGMYAGLLAAALQARLQAITAHGPQSPADVVRELNRLTAGTIEGNRFATVFFGVVDPAAATLTYVNAGHPAGAVLSADGRVNLLGPTAPAVGLFADASFPECLVPLSDGDVITAFSDGLTEAEAHDGELLGPEGVVRILQQHLDQPAGLVVHRTLDAVRIFTGAAPAGDDRTLVVARMEAGE